MLQLLVASLLSCAILAQDYTLNEECHPEDVRSELINPTPETFTSYFDEQNKLQFDSANGKNLAQMSYIMDQKVTFSRTLSVGSGVMNHVTITDGVKLRVVTITGTSPVISVDQDLYAVGAGISCQDAVIFNNIVYVVCLKGVATVADELYYIERVPISAPTTRSTLSFAPASGSMMLLKDQVAIRVGLMQTAHEGAVLFNSIPVHLAKDKGTGTTDQASTKFVYVVNLKDSTPGAVKFKSFLLTTLAEDSSTTTLFACNFISDMLINLQGTVDSRLYVLSQVAASPSKLTVFRFKFSLFNGDWILTTYAKRFESGTPTLTTPWFASFSQNIMTIRVISGKLNFLADWLISETGADTITDFQQTIATYRGLDFPTRTDECMQHGTDPLKRVCTNIYDEKIDTSIFTVFELVYVRRSPNEIRFDRVFRSYKSHGIFYFEGEFVRSMVTGRSNYEWFKIEDGTASELKQNEVVIFFSRFTKGSQVSVTGKQLPSMTSPVDKVFKFTPKDMLFEPVVPTFDSKVNWYLGRYVRVLVDTSQIRGNGLTYSLESSNAGVEGIVFKDNLIDFQYLGTPRPTLASNFYLFGSTLFICPKSGEPNILAYDCKPFQSAEKKTVQMNCTSITSTQAVKPTNTLTTYQKFTAGYFHLLFRESDTSRVLLSFKANKFNPLTITDPIVDAVFAQRVASNVVTYYLCTLQKLSNNFFVKVYTIDDDGVKITAVSESEPTITKLTNPTMIVRCQPETEVSLLDFRSPESTPVLVTVKFDANKKLVLDRARDFWRPNMQANANMKACLFDNNRLLYWYTGTMIVGVIPNIQRSAYELFSPAIAELGFKDIKQIDCNLTANTFVVFGANSAGLTIVAAYDVNKIKDLRERLMLFSEFDMIVQTFASFFDNNAWYFSGTTQPRGVLQTTDVARVYNNSPPVVFVQDIGNAPREATAMLAVKNALFVDKKITIKINTKELPTVFASEIKNGNNLQASSSFNVDTLVALNSHVMSAQIVGRTPEDTALVKLTPRIVYYRTVEDSPVRRLLEARSVRDSAQLGQTQKSYFSKQMIVKDKLTVALFDTETETRIFLYDNTEKFEKSFDDFDQFCSAVDFILSEPSTVHLFIFCNDKKLRYLKMSKEKLNTTVVILDAGTATSTWNTNHLRVSCDSSFEKFFITYYDFATKATTIQATKILATAATGDTMTLVSKDNIAAGSFS